MDITVLWNEVFIRPIINVLIILYKAFSGIGLPGSLGFAIIALTVLIRFLLYPFTAAQMKSAQKMQLLKPHMDQIKERHKGDARKQQEEMARLYKEHGVNPAAGCLPLLIQMPIFIALYNVLLKVVSNGNPAEIVNNINKLIYFPAFTLDKPWDPYFFGVNLAATPANWQSAGGFLLAIPVITAALQFLQTKTMNIAPVKPKQEIVKKNGQKKEDDFSSIMQKQMLYFFPLIIGFFSYGFPVGLSLYWNVFSVFGIIQQSLINKQNKQHK
ncbi:YidC/Oxa1 family membrane protein insertase [Candidatus Microgenomates bacterium]|nr:YidC/Oxa1 family membrane protein insertase [Candidatus Microgenomates bacterium]